MKVYLDDFHFRYYWADIDAKAFRLQFVSWGNLRISTPAQSLCLKGLTKIEPVSADRYVLAFNDGELYSVSMLRNEYVKLKMLLGRLRFSPRQDSGSVARVHWRSRDGILKDRKKRCREVAVYLFALVTIVVALLTSDMTSHHLLVGLVTGLIAAAAGYVCCRMRLSWPLYVQDKDKAYYRRVVLQQLPMELHS